MVFPPLGREYMQDPRTVQRPAQPSGQVPIGRHTQMEGHPSSGYGKHTVSPCPAMYHTGTNRSRSGSAIAS